MKKKFLTFLLVLLIIPCAFIITACGGSDARLLNFYIVDKNGEIQNSFCYAGEYDYGVSLSEILTGIKLKADYSDNSSKELSSRDYTTIYKENGNEIENINSIPDAGNYQITYIKDGLSVDIFFDVYKVNYYNVTLTSLSWDYDDELPTISLSNYSSGQNEKVDYYYIEESDYENLNDYRNIIGSGYEKIWDGKLYSIIPGQYYAFANITFASENQNYLGLTNPRPFTVNKAQINVTQDDIQGLSASHTYYAHEQTGNIALSKLIKEGFSNKTIKNGKGDDVQGYFDWKNPDDLVNASNNGQSYPIIFKADNENYDCYESNEINLQITIEKADAGNKNSMTMVFEDNDLTEIAFDNQEHNIKLENFPISYKDGDLGEVFPTVELKDSNGNDVALKWHVLDVWSGYFYIEGLKEIGEYTFTLSLTDTTNACWEDGSLDPIEFTVKIVGDGSILNVFGNYDSVNLDTDGEDVLYKQYLTNWLGNGDDNPGQIVTVAQDYSADVRLVFKSQDEYNFDETYVGQIHNTDLNINLPSEEQEEGIYNYKTNSNIEDKDGNTFNIVGFVDLIGQTSNYKVNDSTGTVIHNELENAILSCFSIYLFQQSVGKNAVYSVAQDSQYLKIKIASNLDTSELYTSISEVYLIFDVTTGDFIGHRIYIEHPDSVSYYLVELKLINE